MISLDPRGGSSVGSQHRRVSRTFAAIERVVERQAEVSGGDGIVSMFHGNFGRCQFLTGVLLGARGSGGIDRAKCLLDLPVRGLAARDAEQDCNNEGWDERTRKQHPSKYTTPRVAANVSGGRVVR